MKEAESSLTHQSTNSEENDIRTYDLKGMERMFGNTKESCIRIAHAMRVIGPSALMLRFLVPAFRMVFNRHPKMRALMSANPMEPMRSYIRPPDMTDEEVEALVTILPRRDDDQLDDREQVRQVIQEVCDRKVDRTTQYPYFMVVHAANNNASPSDTTTRDNLTIMLFSDHVFSDGFSGLVVLHDLLTNLSLLITKYHQQHVDEDATSLPANKEDVLAKLEERSQQLPLRPSFHDAWRGPPSLGRGIMDSVISNIGSKLFQSELANHVPVLPIRDDQMDTNGFPLPQNNSYVLMDSGEKKNLEAALVRCRSEKVTLHGALMSCVLLAFAKAKHDDLKTIAHGNFKLRFDIDYNMRSRIKTPYPENTVGCYLLVSEPCQKNGVKLSSKFWDVARQSKKMTQDGMSSFLATAQLITIHHKLNIAAIPRNLQVTKSNMGDVNLSNLGRYPFPTVHKIGEAEYLGSIEVKGLHLYNSQPNLAYGAILFVTSTEQMDFSMSHKMEDEDATKVFGYFVKAVEAISTVASDETMLDAAERIFA